MLGFAFNYIVLPKLVLNFMLIGMAFSATFANIISEKQLENIMDGFNPILGIAILIVILNLGTPLDYHLILPHSGVSLVFTGIAVSILIVPNKEGANLIQRTIAAAAVINEIIAVIFAKKGFEWAGEIDK